MANFFDKVKKGINKATTTVGANATSMIEINKIKGELTAVTKEKTALYTELGEKVSSMQNEGNMDLSQVEEYVGKVNELEVKRVELEAKIHEINQEKDEKISSLDDEEAVADAVVTSEAVVEAPVEAVVEAVVEAPVVAPVVAPVETIVEEIKSEDTDSDLSSNENETGEYKG
jgi:Asp-tRNA(Asn)/Glu-tRNA(Gln) amidotransferase C subunit